MSEYLWQEEKKRADRLQAEVDNMTILMARRKKARDEARAKVEELEGKIKKAGDILAEHQTMTAPTYLFNAIAALKQEVNDE